MSASLLSAIWLFAEEAGKVAEKVGEKAGEAANQLPWWQPIVTFALPIGILFYVMMWRPEQKKQAEHKRLLGAVKKNDRVVTIGGIYGVVANVQREADRVTLKIDEANNTKIEVTFSAISRVIVDEEKEDKKS
ncbi:MAG TPA: preprotein translocase subunit YajC [Pirellulales bacterium]